MKRDRKEQLTRDKYITPAIKKAGWEKEYIKEEYKITDGRIIVRNGLFTREKGRIADYILYHKGNIPLAIVEAKDESFSVRKGLQQGLDYAELLQVPFVYSSNGKGFVEHNRYEGTEKELSIDEFPSPLELWERYKFYEEITAEEEVVITTPYYYDNSGKSPRYYQVNAINSVIKAISKGQKRISLIMATGTGKTYTAFQIIDRAKKTKKIKKVLFIADRNVLVDQTMTQDFRPFGDKSIMTKIENRKIDTSYEVFLCLYQAITGNDEDKKVFKNISPDFFDMIIIDECHRGSAKEDSNWREILEYFSDAIQVGLTATPKEEKDVSTSAYFGEPVYTYSLKQGIDDGFLAPFVVIRYQLDKDLGYRPTLNKLDRFGNVIPDYEYDVSDYDKKIILEQRTREVAKTVTKFLKDRDRFMKTIVFCEDINHAERMRQELINCNSDMVSENHKYIMKITGDDEEGKKEIGNFIDAKNLYPSIVTTSKLLSTGVDTKTCKVIVIDKNISSMIEFKQLIGRGTRVKEDANKYFFYILDFRGATKLFADEDFDGTPLNIYDVEGNDNTRERKSDNEDKEEKVNKFYIDDVEVNVINERIQYLDSSGKLVTESLIDFTKTNLLKEYATLKDFIKKWTLEEKKEVIIEELLQQNIILEALRQEINKPELDDFELLCYVAYDLQPLSKAERVKRLKESEHLKQYSEKARLVIDVLLDKYMNEGIRELNDIKILSLDSFRKIDKPAALVKEFGGKDKFRESIYQIEELLYTM